MYALYYILFGGFLKIDIMCGVSVEDMSVMSIKYIMPDVSVKYMMSLVSIQHYVWCICRRHVCYVCRIHYA